MIGKVYRHEDVDRRIMPNRCALCTIGIGTSMLFYDNEWHEYKHMEEVAYLFKTKKGSIKVCKECFDKLNKIKNPSKYLETNLVTVWG